MFAGANVAERALTLSVQTNFPRSYSDVAETVLLFLRFLRGIPQEKFLRGIKEFGGIKELKQIPGRNGNSSRNSTRNFDS